MRALEVLRDIINEPNVDLRRARLQAWEHGHVRDYSSEERVSEAVVVYGPHPSADRALQQSRDSAVRTVGQAVANIATVTSSEDRTNREFVQTARVTVLLDQPEQQSNTTPPEDARSFLSDVMRHTTVSGRYDHWYLPIQSELRTSDVARFMASWGDLFAPLQAVDPAPIDPCSRPAAGTVERFHIEEFKRRVRSGALRDDNGIGYFGTENTVSTRRICLRSGVDRQIQRALAQTNATHVVWTWR